MEKIYEEELKNLKEYLENLEYLNSTIALVNWDMMVNMPKNSVEYRSNMLGYLSGESYKLTTSDQIKDFINYFEGKELDKVTSSTIETIKKNYNNVKKIPENEYMEFNIAASKSGAAWEEAKNKSDFSIFKPHLEKIVQFKRSFAEYFGYEDNKYDALLDEYEPGITVKELDLVFLELRDGIVELLNRIKNSNIKINSEIFTEVFPKNEQKEFSMIILEKMGYDFKNSGRIDESAHPFTINFGNKDVRITNHYNENDFRSALFGAIHEGGHGIYEQNIQDELQGTFLGVGASMGIHESQSRFYENFIGRSLEFWKFAFPKAKEKFPQFQGVSLQEFYNSINKVTPSLIRIEADELTYSLHVIIRYEIEKALINGEIETEDLPLVWNEKYKEYLGVEPSNDSEGVLQDMHWSDGSFGYFPSYALGNLYGAHFLYKLKKDVKDLYKEIETGNFSSIFNWLKENIHKHGAVYKPREILKMVTGEELSAKHFLEYLNVKYSEIYNL